jgi:hypothetical protein
VNLPPLLLGATLLFWGWATDLPTMGGIMAILIEATRLTRFRWELSEEDFNRLWNVTALIFIAAAVYAFTVNQGPAAFTHLAEDPSLLTQRVAGESSQRTAAALLAWLPMVFFPFLFALALSRLHTLRLAVLSLIARRKSKRGEVSPRANIAVPVPWIYFGLCLVAATINTREGGRFFVGMAALLGWGLWTRRSRRFAWPLWVLTAAAACALGYVGQWQLTDLRRLVESFTPQWSWRWSGRRTSPNESQTSIGQVGRLKGSGAIAVRLELREGTPAPPLLRTATYRYYRNPAVWTAGQYRGDEGPRLTFTALYAEPKSATWVLRSGTAPMRIHLGCYLDGGNDVLPLPLGIARLEELPAFSVKTNALGTVMAEGPGVVLFDAVYGYGGSIDPAPTEADVAAIPERELPALDRLIGEMKLEGLSTSQKLRAIQAYFQEHFEYRIWQDTRFNRLSSLTPLTAFLTGTNRGGHCEYFATATTLLLRRLGIPARYAVGWSVQERSGDGYVIRERHAHAWTLAYYNGQWHDIDTTPASWVKEENSRASMFQFLGDAWSRLKFEFAKWRWGQSNLRDYIWWIVGPMLLFLLYRLLRHKTGRAGRDKAAAEAQALLRLGLDSEFYLVEKRLAGFGFVRPVGETLGEFLERAARDARLSAVRDGLQALLRAHYRLRFDPLGLPTEERAALRQRVRETLEHLAQG